MSSPSSNTLAANKDKLRSLESRKILCFSCSCCERLLPILEAFGAKETSKRIKSVIQEGWHQLIYAEVTAFAQEMLLLIEKDIKNLVELQEVSGDAIPITLVEDAVVATFYLMKYANLLDESYKTSSMQRAYNAVDRFSWEYLKLGSDSGTRFDERRLANSDLVVAELQKQHKDLQLLQNNVLSQDIVEQIRIESSMIGQRFAQRVQSYLENKSAD